MQQSVCHVLALKNALAKLRGSTTETSFALAQELFEASTSILIMKKNALF